MIVFPSSYLTTTADHQGTNYTYCALPEDSHDEVYTCEARPQKDRSWLPTDSGNVDWWTAPKRQKNKKDIWW